MYVSQERKKRERQEAVHMLRELRSVIAVRAVETRAREEIALANTRKRRGEPPEGINEGREGNQEHDETKLTEANNLTPSNIDSRVNLPSGDVGVSGDNDQDQLQSPSKSSSTSAFSSVAPQTNTSNQSKRQSSQLIVNESRVPSSIDQSEEHFEFGQDIVDLKTDKEANNGSPIIDEYEAIITDDIPDVSLSEQEKGDSNLTTSGMDFRDALKSRLSQMPGSGFPFAPDIAAAAARRSHDIAQCSMETFGDSTDSETEEGAVAE